MEWEDLLRHHKEFNVGLNEAEVVFFAASRVLTDFPHRLPPAEQRKLRSALVTFAEAVSQAAVAGAAGGRTAAAPEDPFHLAMSNLILLQSAQQGPATTPDFNRIARMPHELLLVSAIDLLEVYLAQIHESISAQKGQAASPKVDSKCLEKRLLSMKEDLGLTLTNEEIRELDGIKAIRNAIVHNRGRADREFLRRTGRMDLDAGADVPVHGDTVKRSGYLARQAADDVLMATGEKHFGIPRQLPRDLLLHEKVIERRGLSSP